MSNKKASRPLEFYLGLVYPFVVYPAEEGGYVAEVEELPGCITQGETLEEVVERIDDARRAWIEATYEAGEPIPLPRTQQEFSGKFVVRLPVTLHRRLAKQAAREGISLNQWVLHLLSARAETEEARKETGEIRKLATALGVWISSGRPEFTYEEPLERLPFTSTRELVIAS